VSEKSLSVNICTTTVSVLQ